jgi:hypothetical protein
MHLLTHIFYDPQITPEVSTCGLSVLTQMFPDENELGDDLPPCVSSHSVIKCLVSCLWCIVCHIVLFVIPFFLKYPSGIVLVLSSL